MAYPTNWIKQTKLPNGTSYEIIPSRLGNGTYTAELPTLTGNSTLALTNYVVANPSTTSSVISSITIGDISYSISGVPSASAADKGKFLHVNNTSGVVEWSNDNNYYPTTFSWTNGTSSGPTGSLTGSGMSAVSFGAIPAAGSGQSGIVTTGNQTFAGIKTFQIACFSNDGTTPIQINFDNSNNYFLEVADYNSGCRMSFDTVELTNDQTYHMPDQSGTIGLQIDIDDLTSLAGA